MDYYKLINKVPVPCSLKEWSAWRSTRYDDQSFRIKWDEVNELMVSTIFIGIEDNIFETMVLLPDYMDVYCKSTYTYEDALKAHEEALEFARSYRH